jgi:hypothetical protein
LPPQDRVLQPSCCLTVKSMSHVLDIFVREVPTCGANFYIAQSRLTSVTKDSTIQWH